MDLARKANDNGDYFPIWGECNGFEVMVLHISQDPGVFGGGFNDPSVTKPLGDITIHKDVKMFS